MSLQKKLKTALDETRLLILGAQVLVGFQFNAIFHEKFDALPGLSRTILGLTLMLMVATLGLLISPSMQHRIIYQGNATEWMLRAAGLFAGAALLPMALSLGLDVFVVGREILGFRMGAIAAASIFVLAIVLWYAAEIFYREIRRLDENVQTRQNHQEATPLGTKIDQMLTEARVILPGAQALLGFQLIAVLTRRFESLPSALQLVHAGSLLMVALAIILLMAPAAFHRLAFSGEDTEEFHRIGSGLVTSGSVPLALGVSGDVWVAVAAMTNEVVIGAVLAVFALGLLGGLWYVYPLVMRARLR